MPRKPLRGRSWANWSAAAPLFVRLAQQRDVSIIIAHLRFLLRAGRIEDVAEDRAERDAPRDPTHQIWGLISRLPGEALGDARWEWLEGGSALCPGSAMT